LLSVLEQLDLDPDPDPDPGEPTIYGSNWIRIWIRNPNPDPQHFFIPFWGLRLLTWVVEPLPFGAA